MEYQKHALVLGVVEALREAGSWTGKTHVQKAMFLLGAATSTHVPFDFVLYKHGPYSFDFEGELEQMKSYAAIDTETVGTGYGPSLKPGHNANFVKRQASLSERQKADIDRICRFVGARNVIELERLASAAWIRTREGIEDPQRVAVRLHVLKPHVSTVDAEQADREVSALLAQR